ncbi:MAG: alkanesulfonate monooxygenase [Rhodospirillaceae bacterium]|nr:alkanesulfonate monooxygenase [Rhodospirillaceae bacterium]
MSLEIIGWIAPRISSEIISPSGPVFDLKVIEKTAKIHEKAGFDRVLIGYFSDAPEGSMIAAHASSVTNELKFLLAHRPGFVAPTLAARMLATLDQLTKGRLGVHIIAGGSDVDQAKDGDHTEHSDRYRRSAEYIKLLKLTWTNSEPFNFEGKFYKTRETHSLIKCYQEPHIPIYGGGGSNAAIDSLAPHLNTFMLWGEPLKETREFMTLVRNAAEKTQNSLSFSLSTRPIVGDTEAQAWEKAENILSRATAMRGSAAAPKPSNIGSQRILSAAAKNDIHDSCLWMKLALVTGARGNSTALVGTPDTVAKAMLEYYKLGAKSLLIRGYDPLIDAEQYGRELIPKLRELVKGYELAQHRNKNRKCT